MIHTGIDASYDLEDPDRHESRNNRLVYYETLDTEPDPPVVASTTWYYYSLLGNPTWIVTSDAGSSTYTATRFGYARNGETVTFVVGETWTWDGQSGCETSPSYDITYAREFRYDSGRARYMDRQLDPAWLEIGVFEPLSEVWSDYDGDGIYGDYTVGQTGSVTNVRSFQPGHGTIDPWTSSGDSSTTYFHSDHLGTLRQTTGSSGPNLRVFTAFGQRHCELNDSCDSEPAPDRYGYVGAWGYRAHEDFLYQHVGARYYDPAAGRFVQRDPIGVLGGTNAYAYVGAYPLTHIDASGLGPIDWLYTGYWSPPPGVYDAARDAAAEWLVRSSPVRGGYVGVGTVKNGGRGGGLVAGAGAAWTIDDGGSAYGGIGFQTSRRGRLPNGQFFSAGGGVGLFGNYGEDGFSGGLYGGLSHNQKGHGFHGGAGSSGGFNLGVTCGWFQFGLILGF